MQIPSKGQVNPTHFALDKRDVRASLGQYRLKRFLDYVLATLGIMLLCPLLVVVALLVRFTSHGPVFFRQKRMGLGGKIFEVWKFRTMVQDAEFHLKDLEAFNESEQGVLFKMRNDPRITKVGLVLRRTSIDELPQFFNILQGHMSLIGPRPLQLRDCELAIKADCERFTNRMKVLPGITGLWQTTGRSETSFEEMLEQDLEYIQHWSLTFDLEILLKTIVVVFARTGAY
jgi:exopolysaccharide biosynthesis polyprenyl glycosylphosphotransferase